MIALLSPRVWIAIGLAIILATSHFFAYRGGRAAVRAEWDRDIAQRTQLAIKAEQAARQREQLLVEEKQKAEVRYVQEKRKAAIAASDAQFDLGRLRDELYSLGSAPRKCPAPSTRIDAGAGLERELLGQCATALTAMAAEADRMEALVVGLQQYVKNVCINQKYTQP